MHTLLAICLLAANTLASADEMPADTQADKPTPTQKENTMATRSERIVTAFNELTADNLEILDGFYAPDVHFVDPLGEMHGLDALKDYYEGMYRNVQEIRFDFHDEVQQGDRHVVFWTMYARIKGLNKGREIALEGNSIITFNNDDLVAYHRDFFDVGAMVYEHVPIIGALVRRVKNRLSHH